MDLVNDETQRERLTLGLRASQSVFTFLALVVASGAFPTFELSGYNMKLGSNAFDFIKLISFLAWLITLAWIISIYFLKLPLQINPTVILSIDGLFSILFLAGGIAGVVSDAFGICRKLVNGEMKCGSLKVTIVFTFLSMIAFFGTLFLSIYVTEISKYTTESRKKSSESKKRKPTTVKAVNQIKVVDTVPDSNVASEVTDSSIRSSPKAKLKSVTINIPRGAEIGASFEKGSSPPMISQIQPGSLLSFYNVEVGMVITTFMLANGIEINGINEGILSALLSKYQQEERIIVASETIEMMTPQAQGGRKELAKRDLEATGEEKVELKNGNTKAQSPIEDFSENEEKQYVAIQQEETKVDEMYQATTTEETIEQIKGDDIEAQNRTVFYKLEEKTISSRTVEKKMVTSGEGLQVLTLKPLKEEIQDQTPLATTIMEETAMSTPPSTSPSNKETKIVAKVDDLESQLAQIVKNESSTEDSSSEESSTEENVNEYGLSQAEAQDEKPHTFMVTSPYKLPLDLRTREGQNLYASATRGLQTSEKYDLTVASASDFSYSVQEAANSYYWGPIVHAIPVQWNSDGEIINTRSIINEPDQVRIENVIRNAETIWGGYRFVDESVLDERILLMRMKSTMISRWIRNSLTHEARKKLYHEKERFEYFTPSDGTFEQDGPTMLRIIFEHISSTKQFTPEQEISKAGNEEISEVKDQIPRIEAEKSSVLIIAEESPPEVEPIVAQMEGMEQVHEKDFVDKNESAIIEPEISSELTDAENMQSKVEAIEQEGVMGKLDEKYDLTVASASDFSHSVQKAANLYNWGPIVNAIPVNWNPDGAVIETRNIISEPDQVKIEHVVQNAEKNWGGYRIVDESVFDEEILQMRMKSTMITKWIQKSLTHEAWDKLYLEKERFEYFTPSDGTFELDGPSMLRIIFEHGSSMKQFTPKQEISEAVNEDISEVKDPSQSIEAEKSSVFIIAEEAKSEVKPIVDQVEVMKQIREKDSVDENNTEIIVAENSSTSIIAKETQPEVETNKQEEVTGKLDEKYDLTVATLSSFSYSVQEAANSYSWGPIVNEIPVNWNSNGAVTKTRSIIDKSDRVSIEHVIQNAERIWGGYRIVDESVFDEEILQMRMKSTIISKWIHNSLTHEARKKLYGEKERFEYFTPSDGTFEQDGPSMLRIIFEHVSPTQEFTNEQDMTEAVDEKASEVNGQSSRIEGETSSASIIAEVSQHELGPIVERIEDVDEKLTEDKDEITKIQIKITKHDVKQSEEESTVYKEVTKALHEQISEVKDESITPKGENLMIAINDEVKQIKVESNAVEDVTKISPDSKDESTKIDGETKIGAIVEEIKESEIESIAKGEIKEAVLGKEESVYKEVTKALREQISEVKDESITLKGENLMIAINDEIKQTKVESNAVDVTGISSDSKDKSTKIDGETKIDTFVEEVKQSEVESIAKGEIKEIVLEKEESEEASNEELESIYQIKENSSFDTFYSCRTLDKVAIGDLTANGEETFDVGASRSEETSTASSDVEQEQLEELLEELREDLERPNLDTFYSCANVVKEDKI